jgi:transposase
VRKPSQRKKSNLVPGKVEQKLERSAAVWRRRCQGATYRDLALEFGVSIATIHNYIEEARKQLRDEIVDLAAQERKYTLSIIDDSIAALLPCINDGTLLRIQTVKERKGGLVQRIR